MTKELESRIDALEAKFDEWERVLSSGDPVGNAQRLVSQRKAKLAEVADPRKLTEEKIQEISADDGSDDPENSANKDLADQLRETKARAKSPAKK